MMSTETNKERFQAETDMANHFVEYLIEKGYPQDSIAVEYNINSKWRADIAIVEPKTGIPIQLFELKRYARNSNGIESGKMQLKAYRSGLNNRNIPSYLVFSKNTEPFFDIIDVNNVGEEVILNYNGRKVAGLNEEKDIIKRKQNEEIDKISITVQTSAVILFIFVCLSKIVSFTLETNDAIILGIVAALLLISSAQKVKIKLQSFEIEIGKLNENTPQPTKDIN